MIPITWVSFLKPYLRFLYGAAYNLHQILEGLGVASSNFTQRDEKGNIVGSYWSPGESMMVEFGLLIFLAVLMIPLLAAASYTVGKRKGLAIFCVVLFTPGVLSVFGVFPEVNYLPVRYAIQGVGALGSEIGLLPLLLLCALGGWATVVLIYDNFGLTDRFRQVYDHFWFPLALVAGVFFVADNGANENAGMLAESVATVQGASGYLLSQVRRYDDYCRANGLGELKSCKWSQYVQGPLKDIKEGGVKYFIGFASDLPSGYYAVYGKALPDEDVIQIRKEITAYNDRLCPVIYYSSSAWRPAPLSSSCESPPFEYLVAKPEGPHDLVDKNICANTVALASECIIPRLASFKEHLVKLDELVEQHEKSKNYRWLYFLAVAVAVGGKVALSTSKLCAMDTRPGADRRRILQMCLRGTRQSIRLMQGVIGWLVKWLWFALSNAPRLFKRE